MNRRRFICLSTISSGIRRDAGKCELAPSVIACSRSSRKRWQRITGRWFLWLFNPIMFVCSCVRTRPLCRRILLGFSRDVPPICCVRNIPF